MAGLSGIVKKISDLVTGTPADDDCFIFGKTDLKKITLAKLKDALGITSINSALAAFYGGTYTGSINSLRSPGTYWCDFSQVTGAIYDSGYGWIEVIKAYRDSDSCLQKIYHMSSTGIDVIAYRTYVNNQWHPTRVLNTTGIS